MKPRGSRQTVSSCSCSRRPSRRAWHSRCPQTHCACTTRRSLPSRTCSHGLTTPPKSPASRQWLQPASEPAASPHSGTKAQLGAFGRTRTLLTLSDCTPQEGGPGFSGKTPKRPPPYTCGHCSLSSVEEDWRKRQRSLPRSLCDPAPLWNCSESSVFLYFILF